MNLKKILDSEELDNGGMSVGNYDTKSNSFTSVGLLRELGDYSGRYAEQAYDILDIDGELSDDAWCDIMYTDNGKIYAVAGDSEATSPSGEFFFKEIFDGTKGDGELLESLSKELARYNVYYNGTDTVDYSIRFLELPNGMRLIYPTNDNGIAYISSEEELEEALEDKEQYNDEDGYWD